MIVRRSPESIGQELRPSAVESIRGPTTPATFARLSSASESRPRGTTNCCKESGSDVGRFTPGPLLGPAVVADAADGVKAPPGVRAGRGTPATNTPVATPAMTVRTAAPTSQPLLRVGAAFIGGGGGRNAVGASLGSRP